MDRPIVTINRMDSRQRGVALFVALAFLLILTLIGITAMDTSTLAERMAQNSKDRNLALQAAETALVSGEDWFEQAPKSVVGLFPLLTNGLYLPDGCGTPGLPIWECVDWTDANAVVIYPGAPQAPAAGSLAGVSVPPRYIIEHVDDMPDPKGSKTICNYDCDTITVVRVTARGTGATRNAQVMIQSTYGRRF